MEKDLDEIACGNKKWTPVISEFYKPFSEEIEKKNQELEKVKLPVKKTNEVCEKCGKPMVIKLGKYGEFLACSGFPKCRNSKPIIKELEVRCPQCGGKIIERRTKKGKLFYGCKNYPKCNWASWNMPYSKPCPKCQGLMEVKGKLISCTKCDFKEVIEKENKP